MLEFTEQHQKQMVLLKRVLEASTVVMPKMQWLSTGSPYYYSSYEVSWFEVSLTARLLCSCHKVAKCLVQFWRFLISTIFGQMLRPKSWFDKISSTSPRPNNLNIGRKNQLNHQDDKFVMEPDVMSVTRLKSFSTVSFFKLNLCLGDALTWSFKVLIPFIGSYN